MKKVILTIMFGFLSMSSFASQDIKDVVIYETVNDFCTITHSRYRRLSDGSLECVWRRQETCSGEVIRYLPCD